MQAHLNAMFAFWNGQSRLIKYEFPLCLHWKTKYHLLKGVIIFTVVRNGFNASSSITVVWLFI